MVKRIAGCLLLLCVAALHARAESAKYHAPKTATPPVIDGKLDDACWKAAPPRAGFMELGKDTYVNCQSFLQLLWDEKNLYVGLKAMEPLMDKLVVSGGGLWSDDGIEIFVALPSGYGQHAINTAGSQWGREAATQGWPGKVFKGDGFYSVELAIPFEKLGVRPVENTFIRANFDRNRRTLGKDKWVPSCWSPNRKGFHEPENFGQIVFVTEAPADWPDPFIASLDKDLRHFRRRLGEMKRLCEIGLPLPLCKTQVEPFAKLINEFEAKSSSESLEDRLAARALIPEIDARLHDVKYAVLTAELFE